MCQKNLLEKLNKNVETAILKKTIVLSLNLELSMAIIGFEELRSYKSYLLVLISVYLIKYE